MTCPMKLMGLLTFNEDFSGEVELGKKYTIVKDGYRVVPFMVPMELADANFKYLGKARVTKVMVEGESTTLEIEVLKVFTAEESEVFSNNFVKV